MPIQPEDFQIDLFEKVDEAITQIGKLKLEVGWFEGAKYDADTPVAGVAAQNEYGNAALNIPPRPFIRPTVVERTRVWKGFITRNTKKVISGDLTVDQMMETLGLVVAGDIRKNHYPDPRTRFIRTHTGSTPKNQERHQRRSLSRAGKAAGI